jgi:hypothetical protein
MGLGSAIVLEHFERDFPAAAALRLVKGLSQLD